jgi:DNA-binding GntR family transcriptional regulator
MRLRIAPLIGELSPRQIRATHIAETEQLLSRARALTRDFDLREYWNINHDMHFIVGKLIGNQALAEMWDRFYFQAARRWYDLARTLGPEVSRSLVREIEDMLEALRSGDILAIGFIQRAYIGYGLRQLRAHHGSTDEQKATK